MGKAKLPDGRRKKAYPHKVTLRLNDKQLEAMRQHFGWMGDDSYVAYHLVISAVGERYFGKK